MNRYLIDGLSEAGNGVAIYATVREDPARAVDRFYRYVDRAVLEKLAIDWGGLEVDELMPHPLPDLFASHAVTVHGRYRGTPNGKIFVRGAAQGKSFAIPVRVERAPSELSSARVLGTLWAREKVGFLEQGRTFGGTSPDDEIRTLGLEFHLVTRFTSLVAVDETRRVGDGNPQKLVEPLDEPEGVDVDMAGGARATILDGSGYGYEFQDDPLSEKGGEILLTGPLSGAPAVRMKRGGCGCRLAGERENAPSWGSLIVLALAAGVAGRRAIRRRREPEQSSLRPFV